MNNRQSWNVITLFLILIFGFSIATILKPQRDFSERENRVLAKAPKLKLQTLLSGEFEKDYEESLTDQFILRDQWIALRSAAERAILRQDIHDVYLADDNYLIEKHTDTFTSPYAQNNIVLLADFIKKAADRYGADHVSVMIVPNAVDILSDKLPPFASPYDEEEYLGQIRDVLPSGTWTEVSPVLKKAAETSDEQLYYRTDHHWTTYSAYLAYQELAPQMHLIESTLDSWNRTVLTDRFEGTVAARTGSSGIYDTIEKWEKKEADPVHYMIRYDRTDNIREDYLQIEHLETRDKYAVFLGGNYGLTEISTDARSGRRLLVIKDSYAHCFVPFLLDQFDEIDLVDIRYFNLSLSEYMEEGEYTDLLFLYNAAGFAEDNALVKLSF